VAGGRHPWQSMKSRYNSFILNNIDQYDIPVSSRNKLLCRPDDSCEPGMRGKYCSSIEFIYKYDPVK